MDRVFFPDRAVFSMCPGCMSEMRSDDFGNGHLLIVQDVTEISEAPCGCKAGHVLVLAHVDHIQAQRWTRWKQVIDLSILLVSDRHHGHLDRYDATLAVIPQNLLTDVIRRDK